MYYKNFQTKNKYSAIKTEYKGGKYDSKKEAQYAMYLDSELRQKKIKAWEAHKRIDLYGKNGSKICSYIADFIITHNDDTIEILDTKCKATETPVFKIKWKMLEDLYLYEVKLGKVKLTIQY
jgi:hypothetical protein